ncbi:RNA polymerase sigma factor [Micromonospora cremea]|uniref:RNA polymerase sigma-70 factor, ECF subfamily n=1 Tax=Micromonospora cremea TaxID=709881 RepID=A0A1N6A8Q1_9ACTN|nr:sigma-70 family RNA polymerase sigma factor [Micromonospora cremea]SIN30412.1 RNA polymerase sigma-70 factor, ECF subfamily [Micromonospora cremea]
MGPPERRDEAWFTSLYAAEYAHIVRYGLRRLGDGDASAELAQEVFVVAWRRRGEVPERSLPWLYGVARRLLANQWRSRRAAPDVLPITDADLNRTVHPSGADVTVGVTDVRVALATLGDLDQEILRLIGWEELTVSEAAQVLGCTRATAAVRLHRARCRLTEAMSDQPAPPRRAVLATTREDL